MAVGFGLAPEQSAVKQLIRAFVEREVKPAALERDRRADHAGRIPWDWIETLSAMGVRTMPVPVELGGVGAGVLTCCVAGEELAAGDLGLAVALDQTWKFVPLITNACTGEQRERFLPAFLEDPRYLLAIAVHEDNAGSDHFLPYNVPPHGAKTTARPDGHGNWVLDGAKTYISNGGLARLHIVLARTEPGTGGIEGLTAFFVERDTPGFTIGRVDDKLGQRLVQNAELIFDGCVVAEANMLGGRGEGMRITRRHMRARGMPQVAATAIGVARAAFEAAREHARSHVQGGTEIVNHDIVALMLADMDLAIEAARTLTWRAAVACDTGDRVDPRLPEMAKELASETAVKVCLQALELFAGAGIMLDHPAQKYVRDAVTFYHSEGTNQVMRLRRANRFKTRS